jgi:hypothetical protein
VSGLVRARSLLRKNCALKATLTPVRAQKPGRMCGCVGCVLLPDVYIDLRCIVAARHAISVRCPVRDKCSRLLLRRLVGAGDMEWNHRT